MTEIKQAKVQAVQKKEKQTPQKMMKGYVEAMMPEIKKVLPSMITPERFTRITINAISSNPKLAECTPASFLGAMMNAAQAGLEPNTPLGQAYLIPYRNKGTLEVQYQVGYKGMLDLAHRAGTNVDAHEVYENDVFEYAYGLEPALKHVPALKNRGEVIAYYAVWRNGDAYGFEVMSKEDVQRHAKQFSKSYDSSSSPWTTNFDEMAKKTVIKKALKYAPMTTEITKALSADGTIKSTLSENMADVFDETDYSNVIDAETGEVVEDGNTEA